MIDERISAAQNLIKAYEDVEEIDFYIRSTKEKIENIDEQIDERNRELGDLSHESFEIRQDMEYYYDYRIVRERGQKRLAYINGRDGVLRKEIEKLEKEKADYIAKIEELDAQKEAAKRRLRARDRALAKLYKEKETKNSNSAEPGEE